MKFTKEQQQLIQDIYHGQIFDILSFVQASDLYETVRYNQSDVEYSFHVDPEAGTRYYCSKDLKPTSANLIPESHFQKIKGATDYISYEPKLKLTCSQQHADVFGEPFTFDFYRGVNVLKNFDALVDFLAIWQFLRDEALILDVPQSISRETVGLFFEPFAGEESLGPDAEDGSGWLWFSDMRYLQGKQYHLCEKWLQICQEFIGRRIYPTPKLKLFIQNRFRTLEEVQQSRALVTAWIAIIVAILIALLQSYSSTTFSKTDGEGPDQIEYSIDQNVENSNTCLSNGMIYSEDKRQFFSSPRTSKGRINIVSKIYFVTVISDVSPASCIKIMMTGI